MQTGEKIPLHESCTLEDVCRDEGATCMNGYCECDLVHYDKGDSCG